MTAVPHITSFYAGILGLMLVVLSWRIMQMRRRLEAMNGDGGERDLSVAVRIQGNFIEYVPMALLLMAFDEMAGWNPLIIHALGIALVAARLAHVHGMTRKNALGRGRRMGAVCTFAVIVAASLLSIAALLGHGT